VLVLDYRLTTASGEEFAERNGRLGLVEIRRGIGLIRLLRLAVGSLGSMAGANFAQPSSMLAQTSYPYRGHKTSLNLEKMGGKGKQLTVR